MIQHHKMQRPLLVLCLTRSRIFATPEEGTGADPDGSDIRVFLKSGALGDKSSDVRDLGPVREILLDRKCRPLSVPIVKSCTSREKVKRNNVKLVHKRV